MDNDLKKVNLWFNDVGDFHDGFASVDIGQGEEYKIDKSGNFYDINTARPVPNPFNKVTNEVIDRIIRKRMI